MSPLRDIDFLINNFPCNINDLNPFFENKGSSFFEDLSEYIFERELIQRVNVNSFMELQFRHNFILDYF